VRSASALLGNLSVRSGAVACLVHHRGRVTVQARAPAELLRERRQRGWSQHKYRDCLLRPAGAMAFSISSLAAVWRVAEGSRIRG